MAYEKNEIQLKFHNCTGANALNHKIKSIKHDIVIIELVGGVSCDYCYCGAADIQSVSQKFIQMTGIDFSLF